MSARSAATVAWLAGWPSGCLPTRLRLWILQPNISVTSTNTSSRTTDIPAACHITQNDLDPPNHNIPQWGLHAAMDRLSHTPAWRRSCFLAGPLCRQTQRASPRKPWLPSNRTSTRETKPKGQNGRVNDCRLAHRRLAEPNARGETDPACFPHTASLDSGKSKTCARMTFQPI